MSCSGQITATFTWSGNGEPAPPVAIVRQRCQASAWAYGAGCTASASNDLGDAAVAVDTQIPPYKSRISGMNGANYIDHYSVVQNPGNEFTVYCSPTASASGSPATASVWYQAAAIPVNLVLTGVLNAGSDRRMGWKAAGEYATLGMILFERGLKQEGFEVLLNSFDGYHGSDEREIFLGLAAAELGKWDVAKKVVEYYRHPRHSAGGYDSVTKPYWPQGDSSQTLRGTLEFLEGSRLANDRGATEALPWFRRANSNCPLNVAISYALGTVLKRLTLSAERTPERDALRAEAIPHLKLVVEIGDERLRVRAKRSLYQIQGQ